MRCNASSLFWPTCCLLPPSFILFPPSPQFVERPGPPLSCLSAGLLGLRVCKGGGGRVSGAAAAPAAEEERGFLYKKKLGVFSILRL